MPGEEARRPAAQPSGEPEPITPQPGGVIPVHPRTQELAATAGEDPAELAEDVVEASEELARKDRG
jgi:hypothetical protein